MKSISIRTLILLLVFYTSTLSALNLNSTTKQQNDVVSLLAFKSKADPGNKLAFSGNETFTVCKWPGLQCRNDGKVIRLVLESLTLAGVFACNTLTRMDQLRILSLRNNSLTGPIPDLAELVNLKALYLDHNHFTGEIPSSISSLHRLRTLDVSYNKLSGAIPVELTNLDRLSYLRLDSNRFNGSIPPFNQSSLEVFNLSVNSLTGSVPVTHTLARFGPNSFSINPRLCEAADAAAEVMRINEANELEKKVKMLHRGVAASKGGNLVFCDGESLVYTVAELMRASAELLGVGTMGTTYKALVDNRVVVCVKRLDISRMMGMTNDAFDRHMMVLGGVHHQNVVVLRAFFNTEDDMLLIFDYQPNGSLFSLIHGSKSMMAKPLHWTSCLKIAEDVAQGLSHLHETCNLVHGNLKSSNVLLGSDFEARVSDYCLSALFHHLPDANTTAYKPPESEQYHEPTMSSDVYAFGVVLLELLTGKCASEHPDSITGDVVEWVKSSRENGGGGIVVEEKRLEMMTEVAVACRVRSPEQRPTMWQVIKMLQEIKEVAVTEDCGLEA
ncbi:hypothetical protein E3N88_23410 [Mikania micrantha]|uniref:Protein kinase domain-containing protein n=1 Tax=Mikania micrantha TaxID=192012 RepID=A0A5N6NEC2_9ASTR|nr:hypothetical protein E3N88_23410 [Mikania micrantha]